MAEVRVDRDGIIRVMPELLANKIAAGEVVERPASAVKELIENSVDAGASSIEIIVKSAGSDLVQVVDDGCGMSPADALACFQRHATSKIREVEDLGRIRTLGFRGEALASIASVARVELKTKRTTDVEGTQVRVEGGEVKTSEPCATGDGTSVAVRNLFFNVPARRRFLKSPATELRHIVESVQSLALANSGIAFTLHHENGELLRTGRSSAREPVRSRIAALFGDAVADDLVPVKEATSYLSLEGFIGRPERHRKSAGDQFLFVNGRFVRSRYLTHAVRNAFGSLLPDAAYPFFVLFLELDPRHVDVNVHPAKAEIKFDDERGVYGFMLAVIKKALGTAELLPQLDEGTELTGFMPAVFTSLDRQHDVMPAGERPPGDRYAGWLQNVSSSWSDALYGSGAPADQLQRLERRDTDEALKFWQVHERYIITTVRSGVLVIDQYAAHQRVIFERSMASLEAGRGLTQQLLFPATVELRAPEMELVKTLMPSLGALGFEVEEFGGQSIIVRGAPPEVKESAAAVVLREVLDQYAANSKGSRLSVHENLARSMARKGAIQPGARMEPAEMGALVDQLFLCESPYTCPDGRPTMIRISTDELARRFGR